MYNFVHGASRGQLKCASLAILQIILRYSNKCFVRLSSLIYALELWFDITIYIPTIIFGKRAKHRYNLIIGVVDYNYYAVSFEEYAER